MFAVGGNVEAARRAGINVGRIYTAVFVLCATLAALGGVLAAARLAAANQSSGGGDVNLTRSPPRSSAARVCSAAGFCVRGAARDPGDPVDLERADAAQPRLVVSLHDHRRGARARCSLDSVARRSRASHGRA